MNKTRKAIFCLLILSFLFVFCYCGKPRYNQPIITATGYKASSPVTPLPVKSSTVNSQIQQDDQALVLAALSGGGTRAAAMSWKSLETLKKIPYTYQNQDGVTVVSNLADEIDYISGISGGSFAAAAWCLYKDNMNIFRERFIEPNIERELLKELFIPPWRGMRLISPYYDRIDIASEFYDREIFDQKTFSDLPPRPVLLIHATDLALGSKFTFTKKDFKLLDSDLSAYPIGYACAASSAFPILLSPMTVINYGPPIISLMEDPNYKTAKRNARGNIEDDLYCRMREFYNDKSNRYIHLADGGLVDNQGLQTIIDAFDTNGVINKRINDVNRPLKRLIIINVNAGVSPDNNSSKSQDAPHIDSVIKSTMITSMDILSAKRWMRIKDLCNELYKAKIDLADSSPSLSLLEKPYTIEISFRNIKDDSIRAKCNKLPTSFYLDENQLKLIDKVVPQLIEEDPNVISLKKALQP